MYKEWPFFQSTIDLVEMVLKKADMRIQAIYDANLLKDPKLIELGKFIRYDFGS